MSPAFGRSRRRDAPAPLTGSSPAPDRDLRAERPSAPEPRAPRSGGVVLGGRYQVGRVLGSGGMASVHVARDLLLGREVAVKLFRRETGTEPDLRLQEIEARVVATLSHSALTTLLDAGVETTEDGSAHVYLVMEYVRGSTLKERLRGGPMEVSEACWLGFDLAEGLDHMHQAGFLHRDVKPANILISDERSARPVVAKLTDFGIAAPIGQPDLSEYTIGTAAYLSPEQVEGHDARPESDVYALGIVLLEAMTGEVVFPGSVEESAFARLVRDPPIPPHIPDAVRALLERMTAREPDRRPDLHTIAVELQQILVDDLLRRRMEAAPAAAAAALPAAVPADVPDGSPDPVLETFVRLVALALAAPRALLVLDTASGPVVKAYHGWEGRAEVTVPASAFVEAGTDVEPWTMTAALEHQDVHPLLSAAPGLRSAAAAPLLTHEGRRIGVLAVLAAEPRDFGPAELAVLRDTAGLVVHEIELRAAARRSLLDLP